MRPPAFEVSAAGTMKSAARYASSMNGECRSAEFEQRQHQ